MLWDVIACPCIDTGFCHNTPQIYMYVRQTQIASTPLISWVFLLVRFLTAIQLHVPVIFSTSVANVASAQVPWCPAQCEITWGIQFYPMLRADSRFWLVKNREIWSRISRLTSSAWDIKTKERHWWRHNGDSDSRPLSLPLRYDLVKLCLYDDLGQINVIAGILKLRKRLRMSHILFEHGINSLPLVCFRGYGNSSTLSIAIPRLAFGRAWYCDAACG